MVWGWGLSRCPGSASLCVQDDSHIPQLFGAREGTLQRCEQRRKGMEVEGKGRYNSALKTPKTSVSGTQAGLSSLCRQPPESQQSLGHPPWPKPISLVPIVALLLPDPVLFIAAHPCVGLLLLRAGLFSLETRPWLQPVPPCCSYSPAKQLLPSWMILRWY